MSAAALFTPGGHRWTPFDDVIMTLEPSLRTAAHEVCWAILQCLEQGQAATDITVTDKRLAGLLGRSCRFVQKGLLALQKAFGEGQGLISRLRTEGRRIIVIISRFAGRREQPAQVVPKAKAQPQASPTPNVPAPKPTTPEQLAAAAATHAESAREPELPDEEAAKFLGVVAKARAQANAAKAPRDRPTLSPEEQALKVQRDRELAKARFGTDRDRPPQPADPGTPPAPDDS